MPTKEELKAKLKELIKLEEEALRKTSQPLADLMVSLLDRPYQVVLKNFGENFFEFEIDTHEVDLSVRYDTSLDSIELTHSILCCASLEKKKFLKPLFISRDKLIARLWDFEPVIKQTFLVYKLTKKEYWKRETEVRDQIHEIEYEEKLVYANRLKVGVKIKSTSSEDIEVISKVATKYIYMVDGSSYEKSSLLRLLINGYYVIVE